MKKSFPRRKAKVVKTPKKIQKKMATETIVNGSHEETLTEQTETSNAHGGIASLKLKTAFTGLQKELLTTENTNGVTADDNMLAESDKEVINSENDNEVESETDLDVEKPLSKLRQSWKSKTSENTNKIKDKTKEKRDSKSVTPTRRVSKRIKRQEEERDDNEVNSVFVEESHEIKENVDDPVDMLVNTEHESTPFENDLYAAQLKEPYEQDEDTDVPKEDNSMDTNESKSSIHDKNDYIEDDSAVGSSHDFSLSFSDEEEEREEPVNTVASSSVFSLIRRSLRRETGPKPSPPKKAMPEPINVHQYKFSPAEVKVPKHNIYSGISGRKPLRPMYSSYYKTKASESTTNHYSLKRKASDSDRYFDSAEKKRFAGDVGNVSLSEKSPGKHMIFVKLIL